MNILVVSAEEYLTPRLLKCPAPLGTVVPLIGPGPTRAVWASHYCRRHAILEDHHDCLPEDLEHWQRRWRAEGSHAAAGRKADLPASMVCGFADGMAEYDMLRTLGHYERLRAQSDTRGYRVLRRPLGFEVVRCAIEGSKGFLWDIRHRNGPKP